MRTPRVLRRAVHLAIALSGTFALTILLARPAAAEDPADPMIGPSQTPAMLSWIHLEDSNGIPLWNFEMSLDRGGMTSPDKFFWAAIVDTCWGFYRAVCALALWFIDWVNSFDWVSVIASPLIRVGDAMRSVINGIGVVPTFLMLAALSAMLWMIKGKTSTAIYEIAATCIIAALAVGVFADPVRFVAGQDGVIVQAAEAGQQLAARLGDKPRPAPGIAAGDPATDVTNLPDLTPEELQKLQTGQLVDTFIRQPTQMINFGQILDGGSCEDAYNDITRAGTYGNESDIRDAMNGCNESLGKYAGRPSASMALGALMFMPAAFVILILGVAIGGAVITAGIRAMYQSMKSIVTLITGLLPGGGRMSLMLTVAEVIISMMIIIFASIFMGVFLLIIQALFASGSTDNIPATFVAADVFIIAGIVVFLRQHKQLKALNHRMAQWMARRPGGSPGRLPENSSGMNLGRVTNAAHLATNLVRLRQGRAGRPSTGAPAVESTRPFDAGYVHGTPHTRTAPSPASSPTNAGHLPASPTTPQAPSGGASPTLPPGGPGDPQLPSGGASPALPPGSPGAPQLPSAASERIGAVSAKKGRKVLKLATSIGAHAVLAYATGGASTLASGAKAAGSVTKMANAARAMRNARRAALATRMAISAEKNSSPGTKPLQARPAPINPPPARARGRSVVERAPSPMPASAPVRSAEEREPDQPLASTPVRSAADRAASRGKDGPGPQGKGYRRQGKTPGVSVLRPGDVGYLTSSEALARKQGPGSAQRGRRRAPRA